MSQFLRNSLLLTALPALMMATVQSADATDRFDVRVEVVSFKSLVDMDPSNGSDEYFLTVNPDVPGAGRKSIQNAQVNGPPKRVLRVGRSITFRNIKEPSRSNRTITLSSDVSEQDVVKKRTSYDDMGIARTSISDDLFREADRSSRDTASRTVTLSNRNYRMEVRVTVIEVD